MKKLILSAMLTLSSMSQHAATCNYDETYDYDKEINEIKNSEPYKKEREIVTLLTDSQNDPDLLIKIETLLQQNVDPNFKTILQLNPYGTALHVLLFTVEDNSLAVNLMNLFCRYKVDPNLGFSRNPSYENIKPLRFLVNHKLDDIRKKRKLSPLTNDQKINFIKILLHNGASTLNIPDVLQEPLMLRAIKEFQETKALQSSMQEVPQRDLSLFNATREL